MILEKEIMTLHVESMHFNSRILNFDINPVLNPSLLFQSLRITRIYRSNSNQIVLHQEREHKTLELRLHDQSVINISGLPIHSLSEIETMLRQWISHGVSPLPIE